MRPTARKTLKIIDLPPPTVELRLKALNRITRFKWHLPILVLAALAFPAAGAIGTTVELEPMKDNTIFSESDNSDGSGPTISGAR